MQISFASKNILLTEGLKDFITTHVEKLSKYSSSQLSRVQVLLDVSKHKKGSYKDSVIEIISHLGGKQITVKDSSENFYSAFFGALAKTKQRLLKERRRGNSNFG